MATADFSVLDHPAISRGAFYPQQYASNPPEGAVDSMVHVADGVSVSCRFFACDQASPTILFFYGNGETSADYDQIAPLYVRLGINFQVADYRGYGRSGGSPSFSTMLADSHLVLQDLKDRLASAGYTGPVFVMGRSMGRHAAFELAVNAAQHLAGIIIESGRPSLLPFVQPLEAPLAQALEAAYLDKVSRIDIPTLIIHGEADTLAPVQQARTMYQAIGCADKKMLTIPSAGHNDLLHRGLQEYFTAIHEFVFRLHPQE